MFRPLDFLLLWQAVEPLPQARALRIRLQLVGLLAMHSFGHGQDVQALEPDRRSAAFTGPVRAAVEPF
jgi:hypothetical protein